MNVSLRRSSLTKSPPRRYILRKNSSENDMIKIAEESATNRGGDLVLQEIWRIKDELSAARGHNVHRLFAEARERQKRSGNRVVYRQTKRRKPFMAKAATNIRCRHFR